MYRNDLDAVYQRAQHLERELAQVKAQKTSDAQRVAALEQSLAAAQQTITRMRGAGLQYQPQPYQHLPSNSTTVLVLGILSITICSLLGPIAWHYGTEEIRQIDLGQADPMKRGSVTAGRILGMISTGFLCLSLLMLLFVFASA